jgi:hypothetical protein
MDSDNPSGADNQQETPSSCFVLDPNWVVGFVDGEGCFSVSVHRSSTMHRHGGWQLQPAFHIYQHGDSLSILESMIPFFGCGRVRPKGPGSSVWTYAVEGLRDLELWVLPFFDQHPPRIKRHAFEAFSDIVRSMRKKEHLSPSGFERLARVAYGMNANGKQRARTLEQVLAGSSETARGAHAPAQLVHDEGTVRPSWRHEELGRNDLAAQ